MGGRASKTKPNAAAPLSRRGSFQTVVVLVDGKSECVDEMRSTIDGDHAISSVGRNESQAAGGGGGDSNTAKVSKVQEILEGKIELKKHQQTLEHLPHTAANIAALELQFSSSEDSDDAGGKKKRKGAKKKTKKRRGSGERGTSGSAAPSPVKVKLNDLKVPKKASGQPQPMPDHFEQIKDAYALAEYKARDSTDATHSDLRPIALGKQPQKPAQQQPPPPPKPQETRGFSPFKSKQQPSPSSSPGKFFANAFENWRKPASTASSRSNHSQIMETRDPSRDSPPKSGNHSAVSTKSATSSRDSSRHQNVKRDTLNLDVECFELDGLETFTSSAAVTNQAIELKITDARPPAATNADTSKRLRSERRNLRIDDTDESIMDDILAEVVT